MEADGSGSIYDLSDLVLGGEVQSLIYEPASEGQRVVFVVKEAQSGKAMEALKRFGGTKGRLKFGRSILSLRSVPNGIEVVVERADRVKGAGPKVDGKPFVQGARIESVVVGGHNLVVNFTLRAKEPLGVHERLPGFLYLEGGRLISAGRMGNAFTVSTNRTPALSDQTRVGSISPFKGYSRAIGVSCDQSAE